jgi:hypothetical protein
VPYLEAIKLAWGVGKYVILIALLGACVVAVYNKGVENEKEKWVLAEQKRQLSYDTQLRELTEKTMQETAKSNAYATFIGEQYNVKTEEIRNADVSFTSSRVREQAACTKTRSNLPASSHPNVSSTSSEDTGFSTAFREFLESEIRRDQLNQAWIDSTYEAVVALCKQPNVVCAGQK